MSDFEWKRRLSLEAEELRERVAILAVENRKLKRLLKGIHSAICAGDEEELEEMRVLIEGLD